MKHASTSQTAPPTILPAAGPWLDSHVADAARVIKAGGLVAFPTETVYGIGVSAHVNRSLDMGEVDVGSARDRDVHGPREPGVAGPDCHPLREHRGDVDNLTHAAHALVRGTSPGSANTLNSTAMGVGNARTAKVVRVAWIGSKTSL